MEDRPHSNPNFIYPSRRAREFESVIRKYNGDEYKAWDDYRSVPAQHARVVDAQKYDPPGRIISQRCYKPLSEAGWERIVLTQGNNRYHWLSPKFKIEFRFGGAAMDFEKLRQECDEDEERAWVLYVAQIPKRKLKGRVIGSLRGLKKAKKKLGLGVVGAHAK